jgi:hypothetical protein
MRTQMTIATSRTPHRTAREDCAHNVARTVDTLAAGFERGEYHQRDPLHQRIMLRASVCKLGALLGRHRPITKPIKRHGGLFHQS